MAKHYRDDQRRVMITLSAARYDELKATARAYSLSMTGIINALIGDYLKAERNADDMTGAGLADRVDTLEKRLATLSALVADKRGRKRRPKQTETDLTNDDAPSPFGGVPADHGDARTNDAPNMEPEPPKASTVDAAELFAATDPAPIRATTAKIKSTSTGNDGAIMETETPKDSTPEPPRHVHDDPHARAERIAQRDPQRVALASSLAEGQNDRRANFSADQRSPLERRLEDTKRRAVAYALHGMQTRPAFQIQGAY